MPQRDFLQPLFDQFDLAQSIAGSAAGNVRARGTSLPVMLCPSDTFNRQPFKGSGNSNTSVMGDGWARGNYAANASLGYMCSATADGNGGCGGHGAFRDVPSNGKSTRTRGVMGANESIGVGEITDGTSNTILLAEIRAGVVAFDSRGVWAMGGGSSALWAHGSMGDANGPNSPQLDADDITAGSAVAIAFGGAARLASEKMGACGGTWSNSQQSARSKHPGGVFVALADGSVHWISEYIHAAGCITCPTPTYSIWDRLNLSADGQVVDANKF